jgi:hypothetical protein
MKSANNNSRLTRSKLTKSHCEQSQQNATWDCNTCYNSVFCATPLDFANKLHPEPRLFDRILNSQTLEWLPSLCTRNQKSKAVQRRKVLKEQVQIDELLATLRSKNFAGTIDLEHHTKYFWPHVSDLRIQARLWRELHTSMNEANTRQRIPHSIEAIHKLSIQPKSALGSKSSPHHC